MRKSTAIISAILVISAMIAVSPMMAFAQGGTNMTDLASRLAPGGGATEPIVEPTEIVFVLVCPEAFQDIAECQIFVGTPS